MKKLMMILAIALVSTFALAQKDERDGSGDSPTIQNQFPHTPVNVTRGGGGVLYDQTGNPSGNGAPAQNFEPAFDAYDNMGADDFVVPGGVNWSITQVDAVVTFSTSNLSTGIDVAFFEDSSGLPGAPVASFTSVGTFSFDGATLSVTLPSAVVLPPGTYWVAIATVMDFSPGNNQMFWSTRTAPTGLDSAWQNPGDGFGSGCTSWNYTPICGVGSGTSDFQFALVGEPVVPIPTLGTNMLIVFLVGLTGACVFFMRRNRKSAV